MSISIPETTYNLEVCDGFFQSYTPVYERTKPWKDVIVSNHDKDVVQQTSTKPSITEIDTLGFLDEIIIIFSIQLFQVFGLKFVNYYLLLRLDVVCYKTVVMRL